MRFSFESATHGRFVLFATVLGCCATSIAWGQTSDTEQGSPGSIHFRAVAPSRFSHKSKTEFLRIKKDDAGQPLALQTAITRFRPNNGDTMYDKDTIIDLIGAVHIGEGGYYHTLNQQFELYDVVLYELVAPQGTRIPRTEKQIAGNPISFLQQSAQKMLGLESQLARIDYGKDNFTHADMSPADIKAKMKERGDTPFTIGLNVFSEMVRNQNKLAKQMKNSSSNSPENQMSHENIFELIGNPLKLKTIMARQFTQTDAIENGLGSTLNRMLVVDRNAAALKVLHKELAKGKQKIAIFYGAAHMPDFETHLVKDFGMQRGEQVWLDAWDLTQSPNANQSNPAQMLLQLFKQLED